MLPRTHVLNPMHGDDRMRACLLRRKVMTERVVIRFGTIC